MIKKKSEALDKFKTFLTEVASQIGHKVMTLRSDNGGEYISKEFKKFCQEEKIFQQFTVPHTPEQNGIAERHCRSINNMVRSMLEESELGNKWWGPTTQAATYIKNRVLQIWSKSK